MLIIEELIKSWKLPLPLIQCDRLGLIALFEHIARISLVMQRELSHLKKRNSAVYTRQGWLAKGRGLMKEMLSESS